MNTVLIGAAECAKCCPPHAIAALAGTAVVGFLAGFFAGRRGKAACACKKGAAKKGAAKKGGKPKGDKPAENASPVCCDSLEALFVRKVVNGDNGCEGCGAEETAEQTAQRLCAEEGIEYDADADIAGHK